MSEKPKFVYVIYIAATPEKVFDALTDGATSERYWSGNRVESDWKVGAPFRLKLQSQTSDVTGKVLEVDRPRRLAYTFIGHGDFAAEGPTRVVFDIEAHQDQVKLTVTHDGFERGSRMIEAISRGWPHVISSLKSYLEAGAGLQAPWYNEPRREMQGAAS
jgi:uncharacterized protein YndB with AHSA1/START domain